MIWLAYSMNQKDKKKKKKRGKDKENKGKKVIKRRVKYYTPN